MAGQSPGFRIPSMRQAPPAGASSEQSPTVGRWAITGVAIGEQSSKTRRRVQLQCHQFVVEILAINEQCLCLYVARLKANGCV